MTRRQRRFIRAGATGGVALALLVSATAWGAAPVEESAGTVPEPPAQVPPPIDRVVDEQAPSTAGSSDLARTFYQLQLLREEVQALRGAVEEQQHRLDLLHREQQERYLGLDRRISALQSGVPTAAPPPRPLPRDPQPVDTLPRTGGTEADAYRNAYAMIERGELDTAAAALERVIEEFPERPVHAQRLLLAGPAPPQGGRAGAGAPVPGAGDHALPPTTTRRPTPCTTWAWCTPNSVTPRAPGCTLGGSSSSIPSPRQPDWPGHTRRTSRKRHVPAAGAPPRKTEPVSSLRITEIFHSLQGEARTAGKPTTFVRLTGCPLRCQYCDTAYAFSGGTLMAVADVVERVAAFPARRVTVTGGEPLAQSTVHALMTALADDGYEVSLETGGAIDISAVDPAGLHRHGPEDPRLQRVRTQPVREHRVPRPQGPGEVRHLRRGRLRLGEGAVRYLATHRTRG